MSSAAAVTTATNIQKLFGSNYYTASRILPKAIRDDVIVFYAFVRLADEIVDNPQPGTDPANELQTFIDDWEKAFVGTPVQNTILQAFS